MRLFGIALLFAPTLAACSCVELGPPCQAAGMADVVFTGKVAQVTGLEPAIQADGSLSWPRVKVVFNLTRGLAGVTGSPQAMEITTGRGGGDCGYPFQLGELYIVYANKDKNAGLTTSSCSRTAPIAQASRDLEYFESLANAKDVSRIYGSVFANGERANLELQNAVVRLKGNGIKREAQTGPDGKFDFGDLSPGVYKINGELSGYAPFFVPREVTVAAKGCAEIPMILSIDRRITGKLLDHEGLPAANVQVEILAAKMTERNELPFAEQTTKSDSEGNFTIINVGAGDYYLGVSLDHSPGAEHPFTRFFYPGTEDPARASLIHFDEGPSTKNVGLMLPKMLDVRTIEGKIVWPDGRPALNVQIFLEDPRWSWQNNTVAGTTDDQGRFQVTAYASTQYILHACSQARASGDITCIQPLTFSEAATVNTLVLSHKGITIIEAGGKQLDDMRMRGSPF